MSTTENLRLALAEEAKNRELYLAFAEKAEAEGNCQVARLFRAVAESELIHARSELEMLGAVKSTTENLQRAMWLEEGEFQKMYARFLKEVQEEPDEQTAAFWERILKVERGHHKLFREALTALVDGKDVADAPMYVCRSCGHTVAGRPLEPCGVCGAPADGFAEVP